MTASSVDPELWYYHDKGELQIVMPRHADDLKAIGPRDVVTYVFGEIHKAFGGIRIT